VKRSASTRIQSLKSALHEFLRAPSADDGRSNEQVVVAHLGAKGIHLHDPATFDAVALKYEKKISTFEEAFFACCRSRGGRRDWLYFDLDTLRECGFPGLQFPERIEDAMERAAIEEEGNRVAGEVEDYYGFPKEEAEPFAPPIALLRRTGPETHRRNIRRERAAKSGQRLRRCGAKCGTKRPVLVREHCRRKPK
jgi:hypothetical protein